MYCLECGTEVEKGAEQCSKCGMTVAEMQDRIAQAMEMVAYAETVGPDSTTKLPPVKAREYVDKEGNPLDPADEVVVERRSVVPDLTDLPTIGSNDDPYLTMPIQKIVDDSAQVLFDADTSAKRYVQPEQEKFNPVPLLIATNVISLAAVAVLAYMAFA